MKPAIKQNVFYTTDAKIWKTLALAKNFPSDKVFGANSIAQNLIFLNLKSHRGSKKELENTIVHELLHSKHPTWNEKTLRAEVKKLLK